MIKRLDPSSTRLHDAEWIEPESTGSQLFAPRTSYRKLVVMIDAELLGNPATAHDPAKAQFLEELLDLDCINSFRYADGGPPVELKSVSYDPGAYEGWAVITDRDVSRQIWQVSYASRTGRSVRSAVFGEGAEIAAHDTASGVYRDEGPHDAADRRRADWLAAEVAAQALGADVYISERPYLHNASWEFGKGVAVCTLADALPLFGLYLRAQDKYPIARRAFLGRGLFFSVGTRELLPASWRWLAACTQQGVNSSNDSLVLLAGSLIQRVQYALEARDRVHIVLNGPQDNNTQSAALMQLDVVLLYLMAAMDVTARVAHRVLGIASPAHHAGWQRTGRGKWVEQVAQQAPQLAALVQSGARGPHILTTLRKLRNSVHGAALQGLAVLQGRDPVEMLVRLPPSDEKDVLAAMQATGGAGAWGVVGVLPDRVYLAPWVFVDKLFAEVLELVDALMAATPVEMLAGVALTPEDMLPPRDTRRGLAPDPFDPVFTKRIRWLLGF